MRFETINDVYRIGSLDAKISVTLYLLKNGWSLHKISKYTPSEGEFTLRYLSKMKPIEDMHVKLLNDYSVVVE